MMRLHLKITSSPKRSLVENNLTLKLKCTIVGEQQGVHFLVFTVCGRYVDYTWYTVKNKRTVKGIGYQMDIAEFHRLLKDIAKSLNCDTKPINKWDAFKSILWFPFDSFMSFTIPYKKIGKYKAKCSGADWSGIASYLVWKNGETEIMVKDWYGGLGWGGIGSEKLISVDSFKCEMQKLKTIEGSGLPPVP